MLLSAIDIKAILRFLLVDNWRISLVVVLGGAGIYLLLPRPRGYSRPAGIICAGAALLLTGGLLVQTRTINPETLLFYSFSALAIGAGGLLVILKNPARAALAFTLVVLSTCGLFLLQAAPFLMAATIIVYAGAIIVTFLFVLMLAQQEGLSDADQRSREPLLASCAGFVVLGALFYVLNVNFGTEDIDRLLERTHQIASHDEYQAIMEAMNSYETLFKPEGKDDREGEDKFFDDWERIVRQMDKSPDVELRVRRLKNLGFINWTNAKEEKNVETLKDTLARLERFGLRTRAIAGAYQAQGKSSLSGLSGPPANLSLFDAVEAGLPGEDDEDLGQAPEGGAIRRDAQGRPMMPADNVAYLGRSLFTDYLLAVELGGTLLLVAAIGAIAIAGRRQERAP